jgi:hypothetical protein
LRTRSLSPGWGSAVGAVQSTASTRENASWTCPASAERDTRSKGATRGTSGVEQVFQAFLAEQRARLKPATFAKYKTVISLLESHLDRYAYEGLPKDERALFERHFNAEGAQHRQFCQLFGPEMVPGNLGSFFSYFLPNKVLGSPGLTRAAGTVVKKLSQWLVAKGYVADEAAQEAVHRASAAGRELPRAEKAAMALYRSLRPLPVHPDDVSDENWIEYDHHPIARIEPGKLWLQVYDQNGEEMEIGPVSVPRKATELLAQGWEVGCSLARIKGIHP